MDTIHLHAQKDIAVRKEDQTAQHARMHKLTGYLALVSMVLTVVWLGLLIAGQAAAAPVETFEQAAANAARLDVVFYATYINAALITLAASAFMAALYADLKPAAPDGLVIGLVFVPVYTALNLVVYLSQVSMVPALLKMHADPLLSPAAEVGLRMVLQAWPSSGMAFVNGLAYAVLGIPSILFGALLWNRTGAPDSAASRFRASRFRATRLAGLLLALNGAACILGLVGLLTANALLSLGILLGGVLFLFALILISWSYLKESP